MTVPVLGALNIVEEDACSRTRRGVEQRRWLEASSVQVGGLAVQRSVVFPVARPHCWRRPLRCLWSCPSALELPIRFEPRVVTFESEQQVPALLEEAVGPPGVRVPDVGEPFDRRRLEAAKFRAGQAPFPALTSSLLQVTKCGANRSAAARHSIWRPIASPYFSMIFGRPVCFDQKHSLEIR